MNHNASFAISTPVGIIARLGILVGILGLPILGLPSPAQGAPSSLLLLPPRTINIEGAVAKLTVDRLAQLLSARSELNVITSDELQSVLKLQKSKSMMGCEEDEACLAKVTQATRADRVLTTTLGKIGSRIAITLTLVDGKGAAPIGRVSETASSPEALEPALREALGALFGWKDFQRKVSYKLPEGQKLSFAVLDLKATGVEADTASNLTQLLSTEIKKIKGTTVISRDDLLAILSLEKLSQLTGEACDVACVAELGGALGVDKLVTGQLGKLGERYFISLRLIDPVAVKTDSRIAESFKGTEEMLIRAVSYSGRALLGVESKTPGSLVVTASQEEAEVFVDNKKVGQLPLPPLRAIQAGRHSLRLVRAGFFDWRQDAYIVSGDTTAVWAQMQARPEAWYEKWWVWTIVGVAVAGGTTAAVLLTLPNESFGDGMASIP